MNEEHVERFEPGLQGEIWYEHWHRYHWAAALAQGRRVLDAACGEGYGSALLARTARHVTALDIDPAVIAAARERYAGAGTVEYGVADLAQPLPLADASVDLAVSFETIEHFTAQAAFVGQVARVLAPGGIFLISSPNKPDYNREGAAPNPHHAHEMDEAELRALLAPRFPAQRWFAQDIDFHSVIAPYGRPPGSAHVVSATLATAAGPAAATDGAKYFLCACAAKESDLDAVADRLSVLQDRDHFLRGEHHRMVHAMHRWNAERQSLLGRMEAAEQAIRRLAIERNRALLAPRDGE